MEGSNTANSAAPRLWKELLGRKSDVAEQPRARASATLSFSNMLPRVVRRNIAGALRRRSTLHGLRSYAVSEVSVLRSGGRHPPFIADLPCTALTDCQVAHGRDVSSLRSMVTSAIALDAPAIGGSAASSATSRALLRAARRVDAALKPRARVEAAEAAPLHVQLAQEVGAELRAPVVALQQQLDRLWDLAKSQVPPGFGRVPNMTNPDGNAGKDKGGGDGGGAGGPGGDGGGPGGSGGPGGQGGPGGPSQAPSWLTIALIAVGSLFFLSGDSETAMGKEISWQEFRNEFLSKGLVDSLEVVNRNLVKVKLRSAPTPAFGAASRGEAVSSDRYDTTSSDRDGEGRSRGATGARGGAGDASASNKHAYFRIGSVETFERQLEDAQLDMGVAPKDFVQVRHVVTGDWSKVLASWMPTLLLIGAYFFISSRLGGGGGARGPGGGINNVFNIGKANPAVAKDAKVKVTFKDVAGCDEAKAEIMEFVEFLRDPSRFTKLGAKIPKGALLVGPPGTGKTLLAKATAGEASKPFYSMSGSDFIEMFVGVGPSRVRDLFAQARANAPCIVFIDEIDAVARARGKGGFSGGNDERENTLNQLLVEMDGFSTTEGVIVLAGTNRADILDKAILRPGRFDRQITVGLPDIKGRQEIFMVHMKQLTLAGPAEKYAERLAALTPGFAGAEISNICNEAAIMAARKKKSTIGLADFELATDRVIGGLEKRNALMTEREKRTVAFHEAGHAIAGWFLEHADPLLKVTIIPRSSGALGYAQYLPKEVTLHTQQAIMDRMCMALGGRASEEINFGVVTTGAADDLDKVTQMAYQMVTIFGMNDKVGQLSFPNKEETQFKKPYSDATADLIDREVRKLVDQAYQRTKQLLQDKADELTAVAEMLLERETISQHDLVAAAGPRPFPLPDGFSKYAEAGWQDEDEGESDFGVDDDESDDDEGDDEEEVKEEEEKDAGAGK